MLTKKEKLKYKRVLNLKLTKNIINAKAISGN